MSTHLAIGLAVVAAAGFNVSNAFLKNAAMQLPRLTFPPGRGQLWSFVTSLRWMGAFGLMVLSWGLYLAAMANAPVSIVQPLLGLGLAVLAVFSVFYLKERLGPGEWLGIVVLGAGLVMIGLSAEKQEAGSLETVDYLWLTVLCVGLLMLVGLAHLVEKRRPGTFNIELILGAAGGILVGVAALVTRPMLLEARAGNTGIFLFLLAIVIGVNLVGVAVQQAGFQRGRVMTIVSILAVLNKIIAVVGGFLCLGEGLPEDPLKRWLRIGALAALLAGTVLLARFAKPARKVSPT